MRTEPMTTPNQIGITIDCHDASLLASFWESCLGYTRRPATSGGPYVTLERGAGGPDGPPLITFQTVPEPKTGKARMHLTFVEHAQPLVDDAGSRRLGAVPYGGRRLDDTGAPGS